MSNTYGRAVQSTARPIGREFVNTAGQLRQSVQCGQCVQTRPETPRKIRSTEHVGNCLPTLDRLDFEPFSRSILLLLLDFDWTEIGQIGLR